MKPWDIIGWIVLGFSSIVLGVWFTKTLIMWVAKDAMHRRTRRDPPKAGDVWIQDGGELRVTRIHDNGMIGIESGLPGGSRASWGEPPEQWQQRVKRRKLWRSRP